jgi:uncharacterized protein YkwD
MRSLLATVPTWLGLMLATACVTPTSPATASSDEQPSTPRTSSDPVEPTEPTPTPTPTADPFAAAFVDAHNRARANVSPPAKPALPPVRWSDELAASARAWAQRCEFEHNAKSDYGENLAARTDQADPATVVASWAVEAEHYDHRRNRCASGEVCGHYTQVVWRGSTTIGCAAARCSGGGPFGGGEWFMWVCNYSPPGNWQGERPH